MMDIDLFSSLQGALAQNTLRDYGIALAVLIAIFLGAKLFEWLVKMKVRAFVERTHNEWDDVLLHMIEQLRFGFYATLAVWGSVQFIVIPGWLDTTIDTLTLIIVTYYVVRVLQQAIFFLIGAMVSKNQEEDGDISTGRNMTTMLRSLFAIALWGMALLLILSNLGFDITTLIAGLGIGGIAIAFALQNILSDLFASLSIFFDKPFKPGDFIIVGNDMGTVLRVGIKTTRIETLEGQELIISNRELTESRINNYKQMIKRRSEFHIGVSYETPADKLEQIPSLIQEVIDAIEGAEFDRTHLETMSDFSLNFEVVYYVNSNDYTFFMDVQEQVNLGTIRALQKAKIDIPFPTQTLHVKK